MTPSAREVWASLPVNVWIKRSQVELDRDSKRGLMQLFNAKLVDSKWEAPEPHRAEIQFVRRKTTEEIADIYNNPREKPQLTKRGRIKGFWPGTKQQR